MAFWGDDPDGKSYGYLLLRSPEAGGQVTTTVLEHSLIHTYEADVVAVCDLNGDGVAEIVTSTAAVDSGKRSLYYWDGHRYVRGGSWSSASFR